MPTNGQYIRYFHKFPPAEEFSANNITIETIQKVNKSLFISNGTQIPNGDYENGWEYVLPVKSNPENMTQSERSEAGIVKKKARDALSDAKIRQEKVDSDDTIYVDENPTIEVRRTGE